MADALLVLADGAVFQGKSIGVQGRASGEVVFNTSMTGYQEMLTDPSYAGQLLVLTYPMIGNYGIDAAVEESAVIQPQGLIIREASTTPSHIRSTGTIDDLLKARNVVGIEGIDTRAVTRRIRKEGVMAGTITTEESPEAALARVRAMPVLRRYELGANGDHTDLLHVGQGRCAPTLPRSPPRWRCEAQHHAFPPGEGRRGYRLPGGNAGGHAACGEAGRHRPVARPGRPEAPRRHGPRDRGAHRQGARSSGSASAISWQPGRWAPVPSSSPSAIAAATTPSRTCGLARSRSRPRITAMRSTPPDSRVRPRSAGLT